MPHFHAHIVKAKNNENVRVELVELPDDEFAEDELAVAHEGMHAAYGERIAKKLKLKKGEAVGNVSWVNPDG